MFATVRSSRQKRAKAQESRVLCVSCLCLTNGIDELNYRKKNLIVGGNQLPFRKRGIVKECSRSFLAEQYGLSARKIELIGRRGGHIEIGKLNDIRRHW